MTTLSQQDRVLRQSFKYGNKFMMFMWRLGMGKWFTIFPEITGQIMVIGHTGRKTGIKRYTPVNYAMVDGDLYCTAAFGAKAHWYRNIMAHPDVEIWLPDNRWRGTAEDASDDDNRLGLLREVLIGSGFAAPLFAGIYPNRISDSELDAIAKNYRLIRIKPTTPLTGSTADLEWLWPLSTIILLILLLVRRRK